MKKYVSTVIAGVALLAIAGSASAQTVVRITGSTAYRKFAHLGIANSLQQPFTLGYSGTDPLAAGQAEFIGTTTNGIPVDIKCSWGGSVSGLIAVVNTNPVGTVTQFWPAFTNMNNNATSTGTTISGGTPSLTGPYDAPVRGDVAMSDSFQGTAGFSGLLNVLGDGKVGVVVFAYHRNNGAPASMNNITLLQAKNLLTNGQVPLSQWTGIEADSTTPVFCVGRDADSGTRVVTFAEDAFGVFNLPTQYQINTTAGAVTSINLFPDQTINGVLYANGSSGYASGGNVKTALSATGSLAQGGWLCGYMGGTDIGGAAGGAPMQWNGVTYDTPAGENVKQGLYTFWSYELMLRRSTFTGSGLTVAQLIFTDMKNTPTQNGLVKLSEMKVSRSIEGGIVTR